MFEILYCMEKSMEKETSEVCLTICYGFLWIVCGELGYVGVKKIKI